MKFFCDALKCVNCRSREYGKKRLLRLFTRKHSSGQHEWTAPKYQVIDKKKLGQVQESAHTFGNGDS